MSSLLQSVKEVDCTFYIEGKCRVIGKEGEELIIVGGLACGANSYNVDALKECTHPDCGNSVPQAEYGEYIKKRFIQWNIKE